MSYKLKPCGNCQQLTTNPKYCSSKCAANINSKIPKNPLKEYKCEKCNKVLAVGWKSLATGHCRRYCITCSPNYKDWSKITYESLRDKLSTAQFHARIRALARALYKRSDKPKHCTKCGYNKFYEVCHIRPIKDFSSDTYISTINDLSNLIALCPNCHWELDHGLIQITGD